MQLSELKLKFIKKVNRMDSFIVALKQKVRANEEHITTIDKEGLSVVEYSLDKSQIHMLRQEIEDLKEIIQDIEILKGYYENWKVKNG